MHTKEWRYSSTYSLTQHYDWSPSRDDRFLLGEAPTKPAQKYAKLASVELSALQRTPDSLVVPPAV